MRTELNPPLAGGIRNYELGEKEFLHVCESYEAAMHYDCQMCKSECEFRKGTNPGAGVAMILYFVVVMIGITLLIFNVF